MKKYKIWRETTLAGLALLGILLTSSVVNAAVHVRHGLTITQPVVAADVDGQVQMQTLGQLIDAEVSQEVVPTPLTVVAPAERTGRDVLALVESPWTRDQAAFRNNEIMSGNWEQPVVAPVLAAHGQPFDIALAGTFVAPPTRASVSAHGNPWYNPTALLALGSMLLCFVAGAVGKEQVQAAATDRNGQKPPLPHAIAKLILRHAPKFVGAHEAIQVATALGMSSDEAASEYSMATEVRRAS